MRVDKKGQMWLPEEYIGKRVGVLGKQYLVKAAGNGKYVKGYIIVGRRYAGTQLEVDRGGGSPLSTLTFEPFNVLIKPFGRIDLPKELVGQTVNVTISNMNVELKADKKARVYVGRIYAGREATISEVELI